MNGTILAGNTQEGGSLTPSHDCSGTINSTDRNVVGILDNCGYSSQSGDE
ncbi:MAG TPA: hypothetical protein VEV82_08525 [Actinomycetota bacterium]|nr:hypothetical protein [Actinomycetota bacterium]